MLNLLKNFIYYLTGVHIGVLDEVAVEVAGDGGFGVACTGRYCFHIHSCN